MQMNEKNTKRFIGILGKIPMFQQLLPDQSLEILKICRPRSFSDLEVVTEHGSKSTEMFILLSGKFQVRGAAGDTLATLTPITSVGEMGIITGQPRTATVISIGSANVFEVSKFKLELMIKKFPDIGFIILRHIILTVSERLDNTNYQLSEAHLELEKLKTEVGTVI